ncbi:MAG: molybdopterin cofactor-binding domain-containing protein [bacterium]
MNKPLQNMDISRRNFIKGSAALVVAMHLPTLSSKQAFAETSESMAANAFIRIAPDSSVTVLIKHIEFGQGTYTGMATLAAEEMDADWSQIRAEHAPADATLYANSFWGIQGTGGSTAMANSFLTMRNAGATARQLLINAAAKKWDVNAAEINVSKGTVSHAASGKTASFGELVQVAATLPAPTGEPTLKSPDQFTLIGTDLPKLDTPTKSTGTAVYTMDIHLDDMVTAVVARPPAFGATVKSFDATAAKQSGGVIDVKSIGDGVAVYADSTYNAIKGRRALNVEWDFTNAETRSSEQLFKLYQETMQKPGKQAGKKGDTSTLPRNTDNALSVEMNFPFLAHAPMEPLDAVLLHDSGQVTAWFGSQIQTADQAVIADVFGVAPANVAIHTQLAGGSFGRRTDQNSSLAREAATVTKAYGQSVPVKLVWTREDDIQGGRYRPMSTHKMYGELDEQGNIIGWEHTLALQSIAANSPFSAFIVDGIDGTSVEGAHNQPYAIPNQDIQLHDMENGVPILWWRSVGHTHTGYTTETFIDALLEKAGKDPVAGRLELLKDHPRESNVLKMAGDMAERAGKTPPGRERGVAVVKSFGSYVAYVAEVSKGSNGMPKVHRVWAAVDCGLVVNPNVVTAQIEGGLGFGLDAILHGEITLGENGRVNQSNFHNYSVMRINEMPEVEVQLVKSAEAPTGVGEIGVPPIGPAVSNAWRRLTGQYVTTLPFAKGIRQNT